MDNNELDFVNNILDGNNGYLESNNEHNKTLQEIDDKREESLYYLYEHYLDSDDNKYNLQLYLDSMSEYEYIDNYNDIEYGDYIRYPILDDLLDIKMHTGGFVAKTNPNNKYGEPLPHLFLLKGPRAKQLKFGFKKNVYWNIRKDSIIFRKLTQDDKLKASVAELLEDLLD
jgi:hypothetical protein